MASRRLRRALALLSSLLPTATLRAAAYRVLCGYRIARGARLGLGAVIAVDRAEIGRARIGKLTRFTGPFTLTIGDGAAIGSQNAFVCGALDYARTCVIGRETLITSGHYFDVVGGFALGDRSWIAGYGSQFWTHGAGAEDRTVVIGTDCYIGSAVRFAPGTLLGNNCLVALGSVVTQKFPADNLMLAGVPARVIRENYDWHERLKPDETSSAAQREYLGGPPGV